MPALRSAARRTELQAYEDEVRDRGGFGLGVLMGPLGFRLKRVVGAGSYGIVCLYEITDHLQRKHEVVVKARISSGGSLELERRNMIVSEHSRYQGQKLRSHCSTQVKLIITKLMAGARHVVQRRRIFSMPTAANNSRDSLAYEIDGNARMFAAEYMRHGDVAGLLRSVGQRNLRLKSEELWRIFHCCKTCSTSLVISCRIHD